MTQLVNLAATWRSRRTRAIDLAVELVASIATLAGMITGSTTLLGSLWYLVSTTAWFVISFRKSLWGIMPLNACGLVVTLVNLGSALA